MAVPDLSLHDVSLTAYLRLRDIDEVRGAGTLHIRRELQEATTRSHSHFVPFLQERDAMGHLLTIEETPEKRSLQEKECMALQFRTFQLPAKHSSMHRNPSMGRPSKVHFTQKDQIPSVGTYTPSLSWAPKSVTARRLPALKKRTSKSLNSEELRQITHSLTPLTSTFQYTVKRKPGSPKKKDRFDILRPEAALEIAKKTNFQSVRLEDTPEGIKKSVRWQEMRLLKEEKLSTLKRVMQQFRKGALFVDAKKLTD